MYSTVRNLPTTSGMINEFDNMLTLHFKIKEQNNLQKYLNTRSMTLIWVSSVYRLHLNCNYSQFHYAFFYRLRGEQSLLLQKLFRCTGYILCSVGRYALTNEVVDIHRSSGPDISNFWRVIVYQDMCVLLPWGSPYGLLSNTIKIIL